MYCTLTSWYLSRKYLRVVKASRNTPKRKTLHDMNNGEDMTVRVWDRATRLFHWMLVGLIIGLFLTGKIGGFDIQIASMNLFITNMDLHMAFGTCVLVLLVFRLFWGITGSSTAQFKNFVRGPRAVFEYIRILTGKLPRFVGHNPAGALMVLALLGGLFLQASSGLFSNDDLFFEGLFSNTSARKQVIP